MAVSDKIVNLSESDYDGFISGSKVPVIVDFWAEWCGPCRAVAPVLEELAEEYDEKLKVCKVNVDENQAIAQKLAISAIPTLILYKDGTIADKVVGVESKDKLVERINKLIGG